VDAISGAIVSAVVEHGSVETRLGLAALRDLTHEDLDLIVEYWHGGIADLEFLGIDTARLGTRESTRRRFEVALRTGDRAQPNIAYAVTLNDRMIGYTLLNQYSPEANYSHWHIVSEDRRAAGVSSSLYPYRIKMYFETSNIARLIHQTRTRNTGVNRMLDKYVPVAETRYVDNPDGVALPGEFHLRYVLRGDVPRLFARAEELAAQR
jgi:hypothetical protein